MEDLSYGTKLRRTHRGDNFSAKLAAERDRMTASVHRAVWRETAGRVRDLSVIVGPDGVVLSGRCNSYYIKQMAQHAAMTVPGAAPLINEIEVA
jgi:osmotically-inducible protein OsmY